MNLKLNVNGYAEHPETVMKRFGITYQHATPQSMADQWWFWNCENVPDPLPAHFSELPGSPLDYVGFGLSNKKAAELAAKKKLQ